MFTDEQAQIIEADAAHTVVYAAPGSGKTTVLTQHIIHQLRTNKCVPKGIMAMTFTRQSAYEMKSRILLSKLLSPRAVESLKIGTFHAQLFRLLLKLDGNIPVLLSTFEQFEMMKLCFERMSGKRFVASREQVQHIINRYSIHMAEYPPCILSRKETKIMEAYAKLKMQAGRWDFDDILQAFCLRLDSSDAQLIQNLSEIQYLLIDEFQDTNSVQWTIIQSFISHLSIPVFVVGDDDQSIYGFRGASPEFLLSFAKTYKNAACFTLTANFRSVPQVIYHATSLIKRNRLRTQKEMKSARCDQGKVFAYIVTSEEQESEIVIHLLHGIKTKYPEWTCAILARTRHQLYFVWSKLAKSELNDIQLRTFHDSKGKEWDVVFVIGLLDENPYLAKLPTTKEEIEEERRLYYVALTRAKNVSYTFVPNRIGRTSMKPSRFIEEAALSCVTL